MFGQILGNPEVDNPNHSPFGDLTDRVGILQKRGRSQSRELVAAGLRRESAFLGGVSFPFRELHQFHVYLLCNLAGELSAFGLRSWGRWNLALHVKGLIGAGFH